MTPIAVTRANSDNSKMFGISYKAKWVLVVKWSGLTFVDGSKKTKVQCMVVSHIL